MNAEKGGGWERAAGCSHLVEWAHLGSFLSPPY